MTNRGPSKPVDAAHAAARRLQAREFHESARSLVALGQNRSYNGAITLMVAAAIAYADAVTAQTKGIVNKLYLSILNGKTLTTSPNYPSTPTPS